METGVYPPSTPRLWSEGASKPSSALDMFVFGAKCQAEHWIFSVTVPMVLDYNSRQYSTGSAAIPYLMCCLLICQVFAFFIFVEQISALAIEVLRHRSAVTQGSFCRFGHTVAGEVAVPPSRLSVGTK